MDDLVRGGWLVGFAGATDPAALRMDADTGAFAADHFEELVREAVVDSQISRAPRPGDGPAAGEVALVSLRLLNAETYAELGSAMRVIAERLWETLRADDLLGRVAPDTLAVLLRGCPVARLTEIARRCAAAVEQQPGPSGFALRVLVAAVHGSRDDAPDLLRWVDQSFAPRRAGTRGGAE